MDPARSRLSVAAPQAVARWYAHKERALQDLRKYVDEALLPFSGRNNYTYSSRIKPLSSVSEKLETGEYTDVSQINDLLGCYIVVPTMTHEEKVRKHLARVFSAPFRVKERATSLRSPQVFEFDATRAYHRVREDAVLAADAAATSFEVQIHTAFEHAWWVVTHDLTYKGGADSWQSQRVAAQLKALVEQADQTISHFESATAGVVASQHKETELRLQIVDRLKALFDDQLLAPNLSPASWSRLGRSVLNFVGSYAKQPLDEAVEALLSHVEAEVGRGTAPGSGSLMQLIVGVGCGGPATISDWPLVDSEELRLHGLTSVPNPINLG